MPRPADPAYYGRVTLTEIATELAVSRWEAYKLVRRHRGAAQPHGHPPTYDARFIDYLRAIHGQPHRSLEPVHLDWLTRYQEEPCQPDPHSTAGETPSSPQP